MDTKCSSWGNLNRVSLYDQYSHVVTLSSQPWPFSKASKVQSLTHNAFSECNQAVNEANDPSVLTTQLV